MHKEKKIEQIQITTNKRKLVLFPTIQLVAVILYTKYELSILYSCGDIFDKDVERKKKGHIHGGINRRMPVLIPRDVTSHCQWTYKILTLYLEKLLRNL